MENSITIITRKFTIIPIISETDEWNKKAYEFTVENLNKEIEKYKEWIRNLKKDKNKSLEEKEEKIDKYKKSLKEQEETLAEFLETKEFTQKMVNNYAKSLVRDAMESEARRKNYILSWAFSTMIENGVQYMDIKQQSKFIGEMLKPAYRKSGSKKGSLFDDVEIENILKSYGVSFSQELTRKIKQSVKEGLLDGKVSLPTYKLDSPFTVAKAHMSFSHDYDSYEEFCEYIGKEKCKMYFNFGGNGKPTIAKFIIDTGTNKNKDELNSVLRKLYSGEYEYCGSSIQFDKTGKKIILNLTMEIPTKDTILDENRCVGVDLGQAIPAVCALSGDVYKREFIGSSEDFLKVRTKIQSQRRRLSKHLKYTNGGHGRKKKLRALERYESYEANFARTYNHMVSKNVVDFALKNRAKYINIECLTGYDTNKKILRNWSFYQLQEQIKYKASLYGIEVRKVNPCYTSQVCSFCGHYEKEQRKSQSEFVCGNPNCKSHSFHKNQKYINADWNAARNIAMSTNYFDGEITKKVIEKGAEYYNIPIEKDKKKK